MVKFLSEESGAVAVDWVVLTGALVGLGIATTAVVSGGASSLSNATADLLSDTEIVSEFAGPLGNIGLAAFDFASGAIGWSGTADVLNIAGLGEMLVLGPNQTAAFSVDVPPGADTATFTFDLIGGDSTDNEPATFTINGETVMVARGDHGNLMTVTDAGASGVSISATTTTAGTQLGGSGTWNDSVTTVEITVTNPGSTIDFAAHSATDQAIGDEYYGIDNFDVTAN